MNKSFFKILFTSLMIGITILTVTIIATMMFNKKGVFNTEDIKIDEKNDKFQNQSIVKPKDKTIEQVTDLKELLYIAINELNSQKYYQTKSYGRTTSVSLFKTYVQEITGSKVVNEDDIFTEALSKGSYISVARQTFVGLKKNVFLDREGRLETFKNIRWFSIERVSEESFLKKYGNTFKEFSPYIFNDETIQKVELLSGDENTKVIRVFLNIDEKKNDNLATARYSKEIKTMSNSNSYPNFLSAFVDVKIDKDFRILKTTTEEKYLMEKFGNPTCTTILHQDFTYDKVEIKDKHIYERHFLDNIEGEDNQTPSQIIIKTLLGLYLEKTKFEVELFNQKFNGELDLKNFNLYLQNEKTDIQIDGNGLYFKYGAKKYKLLADILKGNPGSGEPGGSGSTTDEGFSLNNIISKLTDISKYIDKNSKVEKVGEEYLLTLTIPNVGNITAKFDSNYQLLEIKLSSYGINATLKINQNINIQKVDFSDAIDLKNKFNLGNNFDINKAFEKFQKLLENKYEINSRYFDQNNKLEIVITGNIDIPNSYVDLNLVIRYQNVTAVIDLMFDDNYLYIKLPTAEGNILKISVTEIGNLATKIANLFTGNNQGQIIEADNLTIVDKIIESIVLISFNDNEFKIQSSYLDLVVDFVNGSVILNNSDKLQLNLTKKETITKLTWNKADTYFDYQTINNLVEIFKNMFITPKNIDNKYEVTGNVYENDEQKYEFNGDVQLKFTKEFKLEALELNLSLLGKEKVITNPDNTQVTVREEEYHAKLQLINDVFYFTYRDHHSEDIYLARIPFQELKDLLALKDKIKKFAEAFNIKNSVLNTLLGVVDNIPVNGKEQTPVTEYSINQAIKSIKRHDNNEFKVILDINYLTNNTKLKDLELVIKGNEELEKLELLNVYTSNTTGFNLKLTNLKEKTNISLDRLFIINEARENFAEKYDIKPYVSPETIVGNVEDIKITRPYSIGYPAFDWKDMVKKGEEITFTFEAKEYQIPILTINGIDSLKLLTRKQLLSNEKIVYGEYEYEFKLIVRESIDIKLSFATIFSLKNVQRPIASLLDYAVSKKYHVMSSFGLLNYKIPNIELKVKLDENNKLEMHAKGTIPYGRIYFVGEATSGKTNLEVFLKDNIIYVKQEYFEKGKGDGVHSHYQLTLEDFMKNPIKEVLRMINAAESFKKMILNEDENGNPQPPTPGPKKTFNLKKFLKYWLDYQMEDKDVNFITLNGATLPVLDTFNDIEFTVFVKDNNLDYVSFVSSVSAKGRSARVNFDAQILNPGQTDFEIVFPDFNGNWWE